MKKHPTLILLTFILAFLPVSSFANILTKDEALQICKAKFAEKVVDIYVKSDSSAKSWSFFIDAEPTKNWEHDCYIINIAYTATKADSTAIESMQKLKFPPKDFKNYIPIDISVNIPIKYGHTPNIQASPMPRSGHVSHRTCCRTHAIIISGGIENSRNYDRYWNDCSFIYQTLAKKYLIHKENIYPIIGDGGIQNGSLVKESEEAPDPTPNDLDKDGVQDYIYPATNHYVNETFRLLAYKMEPNDHLFVYVIDHGGYDKTKDEANIRLWGSDSITSPEFRELIKPFADKGININIIMGQCHSGGFAKDLDFKGIVFAAACRTEEESNNVVFPDAPLGYRHFPYDEFMYQWTCAINGMTPFGEEVNADLNGDENVSMEEAFLYAQKNDRLSTEHPVYFSTPYQLGQNLSFYSIPLNYGLPELNGSSDNNQEKINVIDEGHQIRVNNNYDSELNIMLCSYETMQPVMNDKLAAGMEDLLIDKHNLNSGIYILTIYKESTLIKSHKFMVK